MSLPRLLLILLVLFTPPAWAEVQVIELRHRGAEQVLPALRPHLSPQGSLSGFADKLIISTDAANLEALRAIVAAIDQPLRQLLVSVRLEDSAEATDRGGALSGRVGSETELRGRVWNTRELRDSRAAQQARVSEGGTAFIHMGVSLPVTLRQVLLGPGGVVVSSSQTWRDLGTGFVASPSLVGDRVSVDISPGQDILVRDPAGTVLTQRLSTTVSGRLGEWIPLGGGETADSRETTGVVIHSSREPRRRGRILLKVEALPD